MPHGSNEWRRAAFIKVSYGLETRRWKCVTSQGSNEWFAYVVTMGNMDDVALSQTTGVTGVIASSKMP